MTPLLIPASGIVLFFTGFSCLAYTFTAFDTTQLSAESIAFCVCNGVAIACALLSALPLQFSVSNRTAKLSQWSSGVAVLMYTVALVLGILENYRVYNTNVLNYITEPVAFKRLIPLSWITALGSLLSNGALCSFSMIALHPPVNCQRNIPTMCPVLENTHAQHRTKRTPRSRTEMQNAV